MANYKIGIIGASGYSGAELMRILAHHPAFSLEVLTADSQAGNTVGSLYPHLSKNASQSFKKFDEVKSELDNCDLVFCALPHGEAMKILPTLKTKLIVDLGGDFRLKDFTAYESWYGHSHSAKDELKTWTYGLTELFRGEIRSATRVANPGCYPTATILSLWPLLKHSMLDGVICVDALSGTSGAGRTQSPGLHVSHVLEDVHAYKVGKHQHTPEIEATLCLASGKDVLVSFTPHLLPMVRGIHVTSSATLKSGITEAQVREAFLDCYKNESFIKIVSHNPGTKEVRGSNAVRIAPFVDKRVGRVIVNSVIDNLVKGASGQAIQNANLMLGLEEGAALSSEGLYP